MKDHPLTPMRDSNLMRLLSPQVQGKVGLVDRLAVAAGEETVRAELNRLSGQGVANVVVDAVANSDLEIIARACSDMTLLTGGSAIAMPLPDLYREKGVLPADTSNNTAPYTGSATVVLSGSCSAMTRQQVTRYIETGAPAFRIDPLEVAANGPRAALDWLSRQDLDKAPILYATAEPTDVRRVQEKLGTSKAGEVVEQALAACAVAARDAGARRFVVAGGETSGAVTQALGVNRLDIGKEISPGVPWTYCRSNGLSIALTLKSGNFGAETFFRDAQSMLEAK